MSAMNFSSVGPVLEEGVSSVTATPSRSVGDRVVIAGEEYVYCYNAGGGSAAQGNIVKVITACSGYSIAATSLTDVFAPAVGVVKHAAIAAGSYGWIMSKGFATVVVTSACTGDYVPLALGASGQAIQAAATLVTAAHEIGYALNANTGAAGSVYAFIKTGF